MIAEYVLKKLYEIGFDVQYNCDVLYNMFIYQRQSFECLTEQLL
jgi:hypothetical protein